MVVVVVVVAVVFVFVFPAAVYITLRLSVSKPVSMCSEKIRLYATVYSRLCVCVCARADNVPTSRLTSDPLENIRCVFQFMNISNCVRFCCERKHNISRVWFCHVSSKSKLLLRIYLYKNLGSIHKTNTFLFSQIKHFY